LEPNGVAEDRDSTFAHDSQAEQIGRLLDSLLRREAGGDSASGEGLLAEHPEFADALRGDLSVLRQLEPAGDRIAALIKRGVLTPSSDQQFAAELGPYKIVTYLGAGGMGVVLKAYEPALDRAVALKVLRPELAGDANAGRRFEREARAAAALHHPNIVTIHAVGREDGVDYIAMEYVDGPTLAEVLREGTEGSGLPAEFIRGVFGQLLSGLAAAHTSGLVHRDIKPSNLLLDGWQSGNVGKRESSAIADAAAHGCVEGTSVPHLFAFPPSHLLTLKIADFGLARMRAAQSTVTLDHPIVGTPQYMSPEQARGDEHIDHRTDLYSSGVVLYEMLTGRTPFRADTPTATIQRILNEEPEHPRKIARCVDPQLAALALALMAKSPEDRIDSAQLALDILESAKPPRIPRLRRRGLARLAIMTVGIAVAATVGGFLLRSLRPAAISGVRVDAARRIVEARYGDSLEYVRFREFRENSLEAAAVLDGDGRGSQIIVTGFRSPLDEGGNVLAAFTSYGRELWRLPLHSDWDWPDCGPRPLWWPVVAVMCADVDGIPGDELIVMANDYLYPARLSLMDARAGRVKSTFWHCGNFGQMRLLPRYFDDRRPAIFASGLNNKLDGFNDRLLRDGEKKCAHWDKVPSFMILDPLRLDGFGPPPVHSSRGEQFEAALHCAPGLVAYAFLDVPPDRQEAFVPDQDCPADPGPPRAPGVLIMEIKDYRSQPEPDDSGPWLELYLTGDGPENKAIGFPQLFVDRHLRLRGVGPVAPAQRVGTTKEYWDQYWRVIIQDGEYLD
jgi:serine/threonine protein kinase